MRTKPHLTSAQIADHTARAASELEDAKRRLAGAQRAAATRFIDGSDDASMRDLRVRTQYLEDVTAGLQQLVGLAEYREVCEAIERQKTELEAYEARVADLKHRWDTHSIPNHPDRPHAERGGVVGRVAEDDAAVDAHSAFIRACHVRDAERAKLTDLERKRDDLAARYPEAIGA